VTTTGQPVRVQHADLQRAAGPTTVGIDDQIRAAADRYEAEIRAAGDRYDEALRLIFAGVSPGASTAAAARPSRSQPAQTSAVT
jgi:hypothetical protein